MKGIIVQPVSTPSITVGKKSVAGVVVNPTIRSGGATCLFSQAVIDNAVEAILAAIPQECSSVDIDKMFEIVTENNEIVIPSNVIDSDGTIRIPIFTALTGLTPIN